MRWTTYLAAAGALVASLPIQAADNGFYVGLGIGQSNVKVDSDAFEEIGFDGKDTAWKLIAGIRPLDWLAVEASYVDLGKPDDGGVEVDADGVSAFAVGFLPLGPVDVFAKAGLINYDASAALDGVGEVLDDKGTEFAYGAGVQFRFLSLSLRGEYEVFDIKDVDDVDLLSLSVTYTFL
jgi:opacity protein-like surface antigen